MDLAKKWSGERIVRSETTPYEDPGISFEGDPGKTDPSQAKDCDINLILDRYIRTGVLPGVDANALYGDFSEPLDYQAALNTVIRAQEQFNALDPYLRKRFNNDPAEFLEFIGDKDNYAEAKKLGILDVKGPSDADRIIEAIKGANKPPLSSPPGGSEQTK